MTVIKQTNNNKLTEEVKPYGNKDTSKKEEVAEMFNNISGRYDLLNKILSLGIDKGWRKKAIQMLKSDKPGHVLDVATGTGEFAIAALEINPSRVTGVDISEGMLEIGRKKIAAKRISSKIELLQADSENLPFENNTFDASTVAFGVRNFEDLDKGLQEIHRVLKPGAKIIVLEFSKPSAFPVKQLYWFYFSFVLPFVGKLVSGDKSAYSYLPQSVKAFPDGKLFLERLERAGFSENRQKHLTFGIASIYSGVKI